MRTSRSLSVLSPHLLAVVRDPVVLAGTYRDIMAAGINMDVLTSLDTAKKFLLGNFAVTHVLCEDRVEGGHAEDLHGFLNDRLRHPAYFLVLGEPTIGWTGRGVLTVPKPLSVDLLLERFIHLARLGEENAEEVAA